MAVSLKIRAFVYRISLGLLVAIQAAQAYSACSWTENFLDTGHGELIDSKSGLTWQKCLVGQQWNGIECSGQARSLTWWDAMHAAKLLGEGWRLPTQEDYRTILGNPEQCVYAATPKAVSDKLISINADKTTHPYGMYWTTNSIKSDNNSAYAVSFSTGSRTLVADYDSFRYAKLVKGGKSQAIYNQEYTKVAIELKNRETQARREQTERDEQWRRDAPARQARQMCEAQKQTCLAGCPRWNMDASQSQRMFAISCEKRCNEISCN